MKKVKGIRASQNLTQDEFAEKLGVSKSKINQFEAGNTKMSFELLEALVKHCDVDANDFMDMPRPLMFEEDNTEMLCQETVNLTLKIIGTMRNANILRTANEPSAWWNLYQFLAKFDKKPEKDDFKKILELIFVQKNNAV